MAKGAEGNALGSLTSREGPRLAAEGSRLAEVLARAAGDIKAEGVKILDVRGLTDVTDFMVLATGTGERHLRAISEAVEAAVRTEGRRLVGTEGSEGSGWIVVDVGDVVAHLFSGAKRAYYDLEGLWADAKVLGVDVDNEEEAGE